ncbi:MAG: FKBP-type peptidyl-prolyl cis-trans isomerase [Sphaerochaeta sp.]|jgi:FKBP-type peptidyl-prolyl cis-trans isomerase|nr:FKBP-type peptidyl-prolyl cis-trans isomerase [Sphaerochaeta sp.]MCH3920991.1 FKBP-type peptidyl-prolyl cis-trans isomerase [Sphaerochaeta sp.]MCI2045247.1 FKBP-type peptidyl-prolyl cis-trans isomerase [Sphaerochaeta sp.]MCI2075874.1 FKBP-type peptidyl-prolyl cis-trans isomerase [Sphaerochaeta sp.]MCI2097140.1 FKBP-type peptidyl-prolyl cis-trans isomerase [Sphaerochaeta sp.]
MNTRIGKKCAVACLMLVMVSVAVFAAGSKESSQDAVIGRIVEILEPGQQPVFTVRLADGTTKTVVADEETAGVLPPSSISVGDYVEMDLDGTDYAVALRWVNPLVSLGSIDVNINQSAVNKPEGLVNRFSYTYGYLLIKSLSQQGLYFDIDYYVRGTLDAIQASAGKSITVFFTEDEMNAFVQQYQDDIWNKGTAPKEFSGLELTDLESIGEMQKPNDLFQNFSYTYGYLVTYNMLKQGLTINGPYFSYGMLDMALGSNPLLTDEEMQQTFTEYQQQLTNQTISQNKEKEAAFLSANKNQAGVVTTDSGLQYQVLVSSDGKKPGPHDTVTFHYQLKTLDGQILEDSKKDGGDAPAMPLDGVIAGLQEGIPLMNVGSSFRFFIPSALAYGDGGAGNIQPGEMIIFDIDLIDTKSPDATPAN